MAYINIYDSPFSNAPTSFETFEKESVEEILERYTDNISDDEEIECYDLDTGETYTAHLEANNYKAVVIVNEKEASLERVVDNNDIVTIMLIPQKANAGIASVLEFVGAATVFIGSVLVATGLFSAIGAGVMALGLGLQLYAAWSLSDKDKSTKIQDALDHESNLSISGCGNQDITDHAFPIVLGKHNIAPYVVGSPYCTTFTKDFRGEDGGQYVTALYCVGYAPLKLTDFKIDQTLLSYNRSTTLDNNTGETDGDRKTLMHGLLKGVNSEDDNGDILRKWKNNDVSLEILQAGDFAEDDKERYGAVYPQAAEQLEVNANLIKIKDSLIEEVGNKVYKGTSVPSGFTNNSVRISKSCPKRLEVELDFPNGLYAQRSKDSKIYYYNLPVRLAVQWRFIKKNAKSSDALSPEGWNDFDYIDFRDPETDESIDVGDVNLPKTYTYEKKLFDYNSSLGKSSSYYNSSKESDIEEFVKDDKWLTQGGKVFEFGTENEPDNVKKSSSLSTDIDSLYEKKYEIEVCKYGVDSKGNVIVTSSTWVEVSKAEYDSITSKGTQPLPTVKQDDDGDYYLDTSGLITKSYQEEYDDDDDSGSSDSGNDDNWWDSDDNDSDSGGSDSDDNWEAVDPDDATPPSDDSSSDDSWESVDSDDANPSGSEE